MPDCMKCEYHYILDQMFFGYYSIRCSHPEMVDYQVIGLVDEDELEDIREGLTGINPPKQCPFLKG